MKNTTKKDLLESKEFEDALLEGAEYKKDIMTSWKTANKATYERFYETMLNARTDIKEILDKRRKLRTDSEKEAVRKFKSDTAKQYRTVCDFLVPEQVEDGQMTKIDKLVDKIASSIHILRYLAGLPGVNVLEDAFTKRHISLAVGLGIEDVYENLKNDDVRKNMIDIFNQAVKLRENVKNANEVIGVNIYTEKVPAELQYDKDNNNAGLKPSDFRKLVDLKAKLNMANTADAKAKVDEKLEKAATDKQFEIARAELMRDKITNMS